MKTATEQLTRVRYRNQGSHTIRRRVTSRKQLPDIAKHSLFDTHLVFAAFIEPGITDAAVVFARGHQTQLDRSSKEHQAC